MPAYLTVREVAERLRVSAATVYALVGRGELAHVRVSNSIRIPEAAAPRPRPSAAHAPPSRKEKRP